MQHQGCVSVVTEAEEQEEHKHWIIQDMATEGISTHTMIAQLVEQRSTVLSPP